MTLTLLSCAGTRPADLGPRGAGLAPCPSSPNCVCSDDERASHHVLAIELGSDPAATWRAAREVVADWPRTMVVTQGDDYLHAECASAVFGFVDDFELQLRSQSGVIAVRSASRVGYSDMGVNRRRVEALRDALVERGVID